MESIAFRIRAYLVKDRREIDYSSELTAPPSLEDTGTRPVAQMLKDEDNNSIDSYCRF
jgi:hypothetical protein